MPNYKFVASPVNVLEGDMAKEAITNTNDTRFHDPMKGIVKVDRQRWEQAQAYERATWLEHNLGAMGDRNDEHMRGFADYAALPKDMGDVLELGCGVFTNVRTLLEHGWTAKSITLVDPLLGDYVDKHPNCWYANRSNIPCVLSLAGVSVEQFGDERPADVLWDTVILINVLSHCYDAAQVLGVVVSALKPGGVLVFHEAVNDVDPQTHYDVGHPLQVKQVVIDDFLAQFELVYRGEKNYFIGRKAAVVALADEQIWVDNTGEVQEVPIVITQELTPNPGTIQAVTHLPQAIIDDPNTIIIQEAPPEEAPKTAASRRGRKAKG